MEQDFFLLLDVINGQTLKYVSKGILRECHYWSDPTLGPGIFAIGRIPCSFHACKLYYLFLGIQKSKRQ